MWDQLQRFFGRSLWWKKTKAKPKINHTIVFWKGSLWKPQEPDQWSKLVSTLTLEACGFDPWLGQTKDCNNENHCLPVWHSNNNGLDLSCAERPLWPRTKHLLTFTQGNVGEAFCSRTPWDLNHQPSGYWTTQYTIWDLKAAFGSSVSVCVLCFRCNPWGGGGIAQR